MARAAAAAGIAAGARQSMACHAGEDGGMCRPRERGGDFSRRGLLYFALELVAREEKDRASHPPYGP